MSAVVVTDARRSGAAIPSSALAVRDRVRLIPPGKELSEPPNLASVRATGLPASGDVRLLASGCCTGFDAVEVTLSLASAREEGADVRVRVAAGVVGADTSRE